MKNIGILTAGGDSPGLNAAIRATARILLANGCRVTGFMDGFDGLAFERTMSLTEKSCSGILTAGGTILHTSRNKPHKMPCNGKTVNMIPEIISNCRNMGISALVCIGGGGTHKSALALAEAGMNIVTIPKTIDNDLAGSDVSIGFDSALKVATEAVDSLHSTASSHKRVMFLEIMGHKAGWLTLGCGIAGGADVILIPEVPYSAEKVAELLKKRAAEGKLFSIVPVAEGALCREDARRVRELEAARQGASAAEKSAIKAKIEKLTAVCPERTFSLAEKISELTGLETRVTILGHLQRGGKPSATDRILATRLGTAAAQAVLDGKFGVMAAMRNDEVKLIPISEAAGKRKSVQPEHPWMQAARELGISFGD